MVGTCNQSVLEMAIEHPMKADALWGLFEGSWCHRQQDHQQGPTLGSTTSKPRKAWEMGKTYSFLFQHTYQMLWQVVTFFLECGYGCSCKISVFTRCWSLLFKICSRSRWHVYKTTTNNCDVTWNVHLCSPYVPWRMQICGSNQRSHRMGLLTITFMNVA